MTVVSDTDSVQIGPPDNFYVRLGKRLFDLFFACLALILLSPVFVVVAVIVKLTSAGPAIFAQRRVGLNGSSFVIYKFRTMTVDSERAGPLVTSGGDRRITTIGRVLRKLKLDEIPQLWNVFVGDMSLVGPRPEVPSYVQTYTERQRLVLSVRPGITDLASIAYRNEEAILAASSDPERFYRDVIISEKIKLNLAYISSMSLRIDLKLILRTIHAVVEFRK